MRTAEIASDYSESIQDWLVADSISCSDKGAVCYHAPVAFQGNPNVHHQ